MQLLAEYDPLYGSRIGLGLCQCFMMMFVQMQGQLWVEMLVETQPHLRDSPHLLLCFTSIKNCSSFITLFHVADCSCWSDIQSLCLAEQNFTSCLWTGAGESLYPSQDSSHNRDPLTPALVVRADWAAAQATHPQSTILIQLVFAIFLMHATALSINAFIGLIQFRGFEKSTFYGRVVFFCNDRVTQLGWLAWQKVLGVKAVS